MTIFLQREFPIQEFLFIHAILSLTLFRLDHVVHKLIKLLSLLLDEFCEEFPHNLIPTPGYWIECSRQKIALNHNSYWDESESDHDDPRSSNDGHLDRGCSELYEDDEDSDNVPRYIIIFFFENTIMHV